MTKRTSKIKSPANYSISIDRAGFVQTRKTLVGHINDASKKNIFRLRDANLHGNPSLGFKELDALRKHKVQKASEAFKQVRLRLAIKRTSRLLHGSNKQVKAYVRMTKSGLVQVRTHTRNGDK